MSAVASAASPAKAGWLVPLSGPPLRPIELRSKEGGLVIGRLDQCDVRLPSDAVSRQHARLTFGSGGWRIGDLKSRWGTYLNGHRIVPDADIPLQPGDLIRINPWTFNFTSDAAMPRAIEPADDVQHLHTLVRSINVRQPGAMAEDLLALLLESAAAMHASADERALAEALVDAACRASGLSNAAVLRPVDASGRIEVIASRQCSGSSGVATYSRSLLTAAANGVVSTFCAQNPHDVAQSIITMQIDQVICVPLMLGQSVAAFLYLDTHSRAASIPPSLWAGASAFCVALGHIGGLALANLRRIDMERRAAQLEVELGAAAEAQRWVVPRRQVSCPPFECFGESRPGRHVGGDFFDIIPLPDGRLALALGDVSGKGIAASILMTTAQGFLHATLTDHGRVDAAVTALNRFISPRRPADRFLTLWAGVLDPVRRTLEYVDAGHGYALLVSGAQTNCALDAGDNFPLGVGEQHDYVAAHAELPTAGQLLVVSDGIIEQPAPALHDVAALNKFGTDRVRALADQLVGQSDPLVGLFDAVINHAGSPSLADDSTALLARW